MARALKVCTGLPGKRCTTLVASGRCPACTAEADARRGTAAQRGYTGQHRSRFRAGVLEREPTCRLCPAPAAVADHWPLSRRELVAARLDPNDPKRGRGLCASCHGNQTTQHQPGGWSAR